MERRTTFTIGLIFAIAGLMVMAFDRIGASADTLLSVGKSSTWGIILGIGLLLIASVFLFLKVQRK